MRLKEKLMDWMVLGVIKALKEGQPNVRLRAVMGMLNAYFRKWEDKNMEQKRWFQSRTLWVNALTVLAGACTFLMSPDAKLDAQQVGTAGSILAAVNMVLRFLTSQPVAK